jgi:hypothetical protein
MPKADPINGRDVLLYIVEQNRPVGVAELNQQRLLGCDGSARTRKLLVKVNCRLFARGLITRARAAEYQGKTAYEATAAGRKLIAEGGSIDGHKSERRALPVNRPKSAARDALWHGMRLKGGKSFTVPDLVELAAKSPKDARKLERIAQDFLKALARAGIVLALKDRAPGHHPTSNGFRRYRLVRDLGRRAPITGKAFVTDPNADGVDAARIPYLDRSKA